MRAAFPRSTIFFDRLTIPQLAAALVRLSAFVSNDTGPMHIATAVGTSVVALLDRPTPNSFVPIEDRHRVLYSYQIKELTTDEVYAATRALLASNRTSTLFAS
jgi:ADP-heptose:LPS heptosyltransferase